MMSQNRASNVDRLRAADLDEKVDQIRITELWAVYEKLEEQQKVLRAILQRIEVENKVK